MNRASLLHILDHASGISEAEVRELEQLAAAFPYCQTAHLLLAKAAHDRGSMLAGQRLRRAATYAADRELLRALIEQRPPATATDAPAPSAAAVSAAPGSLSEVTAAPQPAAEQLATAESDAAPPAVEEVITADASATPFPEAPGQPLAPDAAAPEAKAVDAPEPEAASAQPTSPDTDEAAAATSAPVLAPDAVTGPEAARPTPAEETSTAEELPADPATAAAQAEPAEPEEAPAELVDSTAPAASPGEIEAVEQPTTAPTGEAGATAAEVTAAADAPLLVDATLAEPIATTAVAPAAVLPAVGGAETAEELPAAAPPIRPPVEAGSSRFEFGLGDAPEVEAAYQLPELPEAPAPSGIPAYRADELLAYALSSGSRFGAALTLRDAELTTDLPTAEAWHPDAAVLAHYAAHRPAAPAVPSSLALIDKFLRSQPRIKSAQRPAPTDAPQADLSVRSTSAAPSLASESLAKIMVKQGKIGRAIEIYEQLMQRQPEKKAYFAAQIDLLNQQPE